MDDPVTVLAAVAASATALTLVVALGWWTLGVLAGRPTRRARRARAAAAEAHEQARLASWDHDRALDEAGRLGPLRAAADAYLARKEAEAREAALQAHEAERLHQEWVGRRNTAQHLLGQTRDRIRWAQRAAIGAESRRHVAAARAKARGALARRVQRAGERAEADLAVAQERLAVVQARIARAEEAVAAHDAFAPMTRAQIRQCEVETAVAQRQVERSQAAVRTSEAHAQALRVEAEELTQRLAWAQERLAAATQEATVARDTAQAAARLRSEATQEVARLQEQVDEAEGRVAQLLVQARRKAPRRVVAHPGR